MTGTGSTAHGRASRSELVDRAGALAREVDALRRENARVWALWRDAQAVLDTYDRVRAADFASLRYRLASAEQVICLVGTERFLA